MAPSPFPTAASDEYLQPITFTVTNSTLTKFNRDFKVELYQEVSYNNQTKPALGGMVGETTVTILFNDQHPPAGSVDELYNADFNRSLALAPNQVPQTLPQNDANPGVSGVVYGVLVLTNGETLIAGNFLSYNGYTYPDSTPVNSIALIDATGALDPSFEPNDSGVSGTIHTLALSPGNQYIIGGDFTSFNGVSRNYIARVKADGSLDTTFNPTVEWNCLGLGGATGWPDFDWRRLQQRQRPDAQSPRPAEYRRHPGHHLQSGDHPPGSPGFPGFRLCDFVAANVNPVIYFSRTANGTGQEDDQPINLGAANAGTLTVNYNMLAIPNDMRVYYGTTNVAGGTGVLIYARLHSAGVDTAQTDR